MGPVYANSMKERTVPKVQVEEMLCPVGTGPPSIAFKEKEVPDTLSATKGLVGKPMRDFGKVWAQDLPSRSILVIPNG